MGSYFPLLPLGRPGQFRALHGPSAGLRTCRRLAFAGYLSTHRRFPALERASAYDGFRSYLPLRGSPGFTPGSLFRRFETKRTDSYMSIYSSEIFLSTLNID